MGVSHVVSEHRPLQCSRCRRRIEIPHEQPSVIPVLDEDQLQVTVAIQIGCSGARVVDVVLAEWRVGVVKKFTVMVEDVERTIAATREMDRDARAKWFDQLGEVLRQDLPFTLLQPMVTWTAADRRLRGLSSPWRADPIWYMDSLRWDER